MPLHRDIHWIGRQWAVTGHGMQLIDQKLKGFFDVEAIRLWDDDLIETMHAKEWLNKADFDKGLEIARKRYPAPSGTVTPPPQDTAVPAPANGQIAALPQATKPEAPEPQKLVPIVTVTPPPEDKPAPANGQPAPLPQAPKPEEPKLQKPDLPVSVTPPLQEKPLPAPANGQVAALRQAPAPEAPKLQKLDPPKPDPIVAVPQTTEQKKPAPFRLKIEPVDPPKPAAPVFHVQFIGSAKFVRPWLVKQKR
jgi:hypothetical protein